MNRLVNIIGDLIDKYYQDAASTVVCNYQDNYYGDQVCVSNAQQSRGD